MPSKSSSIVIKYGGSLFYRDNNTINVEQVKALSQLLKSLKTHQGSIVIIVGGGRPARSAIQAAQALGASQTVCDYLGIRASQQNAAILLAGLHNLAYPLVPSSIEEAIKIHSLSAKPILVMGGVTPGQSTDAVAALIAEALQASLLIRATDVDGIYDQDPQQYPNASKHTTLTYQQLIQLIQTQSQTAGHYSLFDLVAAQIITRSQIPTRFIDGHSMITLKQAITNQKVGTLVSK